MNYEILVYTALYTYIVLIFFEGLYCLELKMLAAAYLTAAAAVCSISYGK
jgi:hypothetical protein